MKLNHNRSLNRRSLFLPLAALALLALPALVNAQNLVVGSYFGNYADEFTPDGTNLGVLATSSGTSRFNGMAFDTNGYLYVAGVYSNNVRRFSPTGVDLGDYATFGSNFTSDVAFDRSGNLYVSNASADVFTYNGNIHRYSPTGVDLGIFAYVGHPGYMAFDNSGNLYVVGDGGIHRFSPTGQDLGVFTPATGGLALDSAGYLYVAFGGRTNGHVERYSPTGQDLGVFASSGIDDPREIKFDALGNLYVANYGASYGNSVSKFSPTGASLGYFETAVFDPVALAFRPFAASAVPEPGAVALLTGTAFCAGSVFLRRRRKQAH